MVIKLTDSSGGSDVTLVHGSGRASATYAQGPANANLEFSGTQQVQITPLTRSDYAQVLPRSNHQGVLPFAALRTFSTTAAAVLWAADHVLDCQGLTRLQIVDTNTVKLHGALSRCSPKVIGVSVITSYVFTFGQVEEVAS